jgi:RNA recognition motif. (a.k.a. RRM, RBD, or RNP domain)
MYQIIYFSWTNDKYNLQTINFKTCLLQFQEEKELKERQEREKQLAEEKRLAEEKLKNEREAAEKRKFAWFCSRRTCTAHIITHCPLTVAEEKRLQEEKQKQEQAEREKKEREEKLKQEQAEKLKMEQEKTKEQAIAEPKKDIDTREIRQEYQPNQPNVVETNPNDTPKFDEDDRQTGDMNEENNSCGDDDDDDNGFGNNDNGGDNNQFMNVPPMLNRPGTMGRHPPSLNFENQRMMRDTFDVPGCVVALSNLPYRCNTFDLQEYFQPFNIYEHHIMRRYNDRGQPTGDARVCFQSPNDAMRALNLVRNKKMHNRKVFLSIM